MIVTLQAGDGSGRTAVVNGSGQLSTEVGNTVTVSVPDTVTVKRRVVTVERTAAVVGTSSGQVLASRTNRSGLWVQNQDATKSVYIRFGSANATTGDWKVPPGGEFRTEELQCEQAVQAIASGADTSVLFLEMVEGP